MANIKDVAKLAAVSTATVSRVINGSTNVKPVTRERVIEAIKVLKFTPNISAQGLQKKSTRTIGLIFPDATSSYFAEIIRGIANQIRKLDYHIVIASSHDEEDELETLATLLKSGRVDGMILMMPIVRNIDLLTSALKEVPSVFLNTNIKTVKSTRIVIDNYQGAKSITEHLIQHGHSQIAFIHGTKHNYDSEKRYLGYADVMKKAGFELNSKFEVWGNFTEDSGFQSALDLLKYSPGPTAIFAANDSMAIGAIEAARTLSLKVPEDIAIIGFDDIPTARYVNPSLTTVHVPTYKIGKIAAFELYNQLSNKSYQPNDKIVIPLQLVVRESCGCTVMSKIDI
jgi:LacI family transcriptional regulator